MKEAERIESLAGQRCIASAFPDLSQDGLLVFLEPL